MDGHHRHGSSNEQAAPYPELNLNPGAKWIKSLTRNRIDTFRKSVQHAADHFSSNLRRGL
jgi:hypothetical protein